MQNRLTTIDINKLRRKLNRARLACLAAIELGDFHAVARLTCEAARLRDMIAFAPSLGLGRA